MLKLSYKNISMDTTKGRNIIADELLKALSNNKHKLVCDDDDFEIGPWKDEDGNCGY